MKRATFIKRGNFIYFGKLGVAYGELYTKTKKRGHVSLAVKYLKKALRIAKNHDKPYEEYKWLESKLGLNISRLGLYLIEKGRSSLALSTIQKYLGSPYLSAYGRLWITLSLAYEKLGDYEKQYQSADNGYGLRPRKLNNSEKQFFNINYIKSIYNIVLKKYFVSKKYKSALKILEKSIKIFTNETWFYVNLAFAYNSLGKYSSGLKYAELSIQKIPENTAFEEKDKIYNNLRISIHNIAMKEIKKANFKKALNIYKRFLNIYKNDYVLLSLTGKLLMKMGKNELAIKYLNNSRNEYKNKYRILKAPVKLTLPFLPGRVYKCIQGINSGITHIGFDKYAWDFAKVNNEFRIYKKNTPSSNTDFYSWNDIVISPCSGTVIKVINNQNDNEYGRTNYLANSIIIRHKSGYRIHLVHFKKNSITVKVGDHINRGKILGRVGNSGYSKMPHLHLMVTDKRNVSVPSSFYYLKEYIGRPDKFRTLLRNYIPKDNSYYKNHRFFKNIRD